MNQRLNDQSPSCGSKGGREILDALRVGISAQGLAVDVLPIYCLGQCERGPNVRIVGGRFFYGAKLEEVAEILDAVSKALKAETPGQAESGDD